MDCLPGLMRSVYPNKMFLLFSLWRSFVEHRLFSNLTIFAIHVLVLTIKVEICLGHHTLLFSVYLCFLCNHMESKMWFLLFMWFWLLFLRVDRPISIWVCWLFLKCLCLSQRHSTVLWLCHMIFCMILS